MWLCCHDELPSTWCLGVVLGKLNLWRQQTMGDSHTHLITLFKFYCLLKKVLLYNVESNVETLKWKKKAYYMLYSELTFLLLRICMKDFIRVWTWHICSSKTGSGLPQHTQEAALWHTHRINKSFIRATTSSHWPLSNKNNSQLSIWAVGQYLEWPTLLYQKLHLLEEE